MIDAFTAFRNCISDKRCQGCEYGCGGHERKVPVPLSLALALCREIRENEKQVDAVNVARSYNGVYVQGRCPECNNWLTKGHNPKFCGHCGRAIVWR